MRRAARKPLGPEQARHRALADPTRHRILRALVEPLHTAAIAARFGLHPNTVRWHLEVLTEAGLVVSESARPAGRGRPRLVYQAVDAGRAGAAEGLGLLTEALAASLAGAGVESAPLTEEAGRAWGRYLVRRPPPSRSVSAEQAVDEVVRVLRGIGFDLRAAAADEGYELRVRPCPFGEAARAHPDVVCPVHLGLMRGALAELGAPLDAERLEPFVEPDLCLAHLAPAEPAPS